MPRRGRNGTAGSTSSPSFGMSLADIRMRPIGALQYPVRRGVDECLREWNRIVERAGSPPKRARNRDAFDPCERIAHQIEQLAKGLLDRVPLRLAHGPM